MLELVWTDSRKRISWCEVDVQRSRAVNVGAGCQETSCIRAEEVGRARQDIKRSWDVRKGSDATNIK